MRQGVRRVAVIGCGWLGRQLLEHLSPRYALMATTAGSRLAVPTYTYRVETDLLPAPLLAAEAFIIALPPSAGGRERYGAHIRRLMEQLPQEAYVLMVSSTGVYPPAPGEYDEDSAIDPEHPVSRAEAAVRAHPRATILRSGGQYGAGRWPKPRGSVVDDKMLNFVSGSNLCRAIATLLAAPQPGKIYNLVEPEHPLWSAYLQRHARHIAPPYPQLLASDTPPRLIDGSRITRETGFCYEDEKFSHS